MKIPVHDHDATLVTLKTVNNAETANIIRNLLERVGINARIEGEHQAGFTGALEIKVLVRQCDLAAATKMLDTSF